MKSVLQLFFEIKFLFVSQSIENEILHIQKKFQEFWTILSKNIAKNLRKNQKFEFFIFLTKLSFWSIFFARMVLIS